MDKIQKLLRKISKKDSNRIADVFEKINSGKINGLDIKKLKGYPNVFRVRIGNYRVIYKTFNNKNWIIEISKRNDTIYNKKF